MLSQDDCGQEPELLFTLEMRSTCFVAGTFLSPSFRVSAFTLIAYRCLNVCTNQADKCGDDTRSRVNLSTTVTIVGKIFYNLSVNKNQTITFAYLPSSIAISLLPRHPLVVSQV